MLFKKTRGNDLLLIGSKGVAFPNVSKTRSATLGVVSTIFWSLLVIVTIKYVGFILRADNGGEGGILALTALVERSVGKADKHGRRRGRARLIALLFGVVSASLFYGDSVITPAISVISAIEGVAVVNPDLSQWVVPLGALIIIALSVVSLDLCWLRTLCWCRRTSG